MGDVKEIVSVSLCKVPKDFGEAKIQIRLSLQVAWALTLALSSLI